MAAGDIMPYKAFSGGHVEIEHGRLEGGETFRIGEPVGFAAAGTISECATQPVPDQILGIALANGEAVTADTPSATVIRTGLTYPHTGGLGAPADGDLLPVAVAHPTQRFITANFFNNSDTAAAFTGANRGDPVSLRLTAGGAWGVDIGATNEIGRIVDILDADMNPVTETGTGAFVVFTLGLTQLTGPDGAVLGDPAA